MAAGDARLLARDDAGDRRPLTRTLATLDHTLVKAAVGELRDRLPALTDRLVTELGEGADPVRRRFYRGPAFRESAHAGLCAALDAIASRGRERPDMPYARRLGRLYAERRMPLDTVLRAYRLAGTLMWEEAVEIVTAREAGELAALAIEARRVFEMIDQLSTSVTESYNETLRSLGRAQTARAYRVLDDLLDGHGGEPARVREAAAGLSLPEYGRYAVVMLGTGEPPAPAPGLPAVVGSVRVLWRDRPGVRLGVARLGPASLGEFTAALREVVTVPAGVGLPVERLRDLGRARWLAELACRARPGDGPGVARLDEHLPAAFVAALPALAACLRIRVLGALLDLAPAERDLLLETVRAWIDNAGSTAGAARRLFCHRNTVLGRIRRVERLTGRRLDHPGEAVELILAIEADRIQRAGRVNETDSAAPGR